MWCKIYFGRLGVLKGVLWVCFCKRCVAGVFLWNFLGWVNGRETGLSDGFLLGYFEWTPDGLFGRIFGLNL